MRRDVARGEGEIGLLGLAIGAAPAIRGLFHPYLVGETSRGVAVARYVYVCMRARGCMCVCVSRHRCRRCPHPRSSTYSIPPLSRRVRSRTRAHIRDSARGCAVSSTSLRLCVCVVCVARIYTLMRTGTCAHACGRAGLPRQRQCLRERCL